MPKRPSKIKKRKKAPQEDVSQLAHRLVRESTEEEIAPSLTKDQISQLMSEMGRRGGKIGGKRRLETMTPEQRSRAALRAAQARWRKRSDATQPR